MFYFYKYLEILKIAKEILDLQEKNGQINTDSHLNTKSIYNKAFNTLINQGLPSREFGEKILIETDGFVYELDKKDIINKSMLSVIYNEKNIVKTPIENEYDKNINDTGIEEYEEELEENKLSEDMKKEIYEKRGLTNPEEAMGDDYKEEDESLEIIDEEESEDLTANKNQETQDDTQIKEREDIKDEDKKEIEDKNIDEEKHESFKTNENQEQEKETKTKEDKEFEKDIEDLSSMGEDDADEDEVMDIEEPDDFDIENIPEDFAEPTDMFDNLGEDPMNADPFEDEMNEFNDMEPEVQEEDVPEDAIPEDEEIKDEKTTNEDVKSEDKHKIEPISNLHKSGFMLSNISAKYVREETGRSDKIEIMAMPIYPNEESGPQLACVVINKKVKTVFSTDKNPDINIVLDPDTNAILKCNFTDGQYDPILTLDEDYGDRDINILGKRNMGDTGHLQAYDEGSNTEIHIMPINFNNSKKTGKANYAYYIKINDDIITGDTITNPDAAFELGDETVYITCKWDEGDDNLYIRLD